MTPHEIKLRRLELGLTVSELAEVLQITSGELLAIESGQSRFFESDAFEDAFQSLEEALAGTWTGV